ncbi:MAG: hypothetical protein K6E54_10605 [Bacteroidaceae bacterium]|nr:hypothetical protein [Bacteroidaceae bacterium]
MKRKYEQPLVEFYDFKVAFSVLNESGLGEPGDEGDAKMRGSSFGDDRFSRSGNNSSKKNGWGSLW